MTTLNENFSRHLPAVSPHPNMKVPPEILDLSNGSSMLSENLGNRRPVEYDFLFYSPEFLLAGWPQRMAFVDLED